MMKWFKKNQSTPVDESAVRQDNHEPSAHHSTPIAPESTKGFFSRIKDRLTRTRQQLGTGLGRLLAGRKEIDAALLDDLETLLISSDVGLSLTKEIIAEMTDGLNRQQLKEGDAVYHALKSKLLSILSPVEKPIDIDASSGRPFVILMVGINGAGKTTTIGKLAKRYQAEGHKVMLAAGDTFRAAAVEQLQKWGERNAVPVIAQHTGADSASVVFDALQAAKARGYDVLIADTAGRLHTQAHLMQELQKIKRVLQKLDADAPHETLLVLDASIGQNALNQARQFHEAIGLTGMVMTKLDGTAKGGILFAIAHELGIPFRYIGLGEGIDDLRPFDSAQFVDAILDDDHIQSS